MSESCLPLAERACFEAFLSCYLQEHGDGAWHAAASWRREQDPSWPGRGDFVLELALPRQRFAIDVTYRSAVGRHHFGKLRSERAGAWSDAERLPTVLSLVHELYATRGAGKSEARAHELELVLRFVESQQLMARYLGSRADDRALDSDRFIDSEQSMLYGHWRHPTPKSRQGMTEWQHDSYAPELRGRFQLHYFAVARWLVRQQSALPHSAEQLLAQTLAGSAQGKQALRVATERGEVLIPAHPLQVDWLLHQPHVQSWLADGALRDVGRLGPRYTATSSVRTVYSEDCAFMVKLSIPVKITNSLRFNRKAELPAGVSMAHLFAALGDRAGLRVIPDPAYITVDHPDGGESGFELLLRENPFRRGSDTGIYCVAALVQESLPHRASRLRTLIEGLSLTEGRSVPAVSFDWLSRYLDTAIEPLIRLYDEHGVALEAHQQNSLIDVTAGYPRASYFRDSQGYYLSNQHRARLVALQPELLKRPELFFDDETIVKRFSYYLMSNHLFAVVHRLGAEGLLHEELALALVKSRLVSLQARLSGPGRPLLQRLLEQPRLPYKANLLTRLHDIDELTCESSQALYIDVENPLTRALPTLAQELEVA
jgi:spermidine-citrate ligase